MLIHRWKLLEYLRVIHVLKFGVERNEGVKSHCLMFSQATIICMICVGLLMDGSTWMLNPEPDCCDPLPKEEGDPKSALILTWSMFRISPEDAIHFADWSSHCVPAIPGRYKVWILCISIGGTTPANVRTHYGFSLYATHVFFFVGIKCIRGLCLCGPRGCKGMMNRPRGWVHANLNIPEGRRRKKDKSKLDPPQQPKTKYNQDQ